MVNLKTLLSQTESESLDFKQQFHDNNIKLLHDIICLANSYVEGDRYIVFGVTDDKKIVGVKSDSKRKTSAALQNLIKDSNFNRLPTVKIETFNCEDNKEIDILIIKNRPDKPFFLTKDKKDDKQFQKEIIRAGVIYTRLGDTNTSLNGSATEVQIELMWRERFGLGLPPLERMKQLLDDVENWGSVDEYAQLYHNQFPEFTVHLGEKIDYYEESWPQLLDLKAYYIYVELRYFNTILYKEKFVICNSRYYIPIPIIESLNTESLNTERNFYILTNSFAYKIASLIWQHHPIDNALEKAGIELRI